MTRPSRLAARRAHRDALRAAYAERSAREAAEALAAAAAAHERRRQEAAAASREWWARMREEARRRELERQERERLALERAAAAEGLTVAEYVELQAARQQLVTLLRRRARFMALVESVDPETRLWVQPHVGLRTALLLCATLGAFGGTE